MLLHTDTLEQLIKDHRFVQLTFKNQSTQYTAFGSVLLPAAWAMNSTLVRVLLDQVEVIAPVKRHLWALVDKLLYGGRTTLVHAVLHEHACISEDDDETPAPVMDAWLLETYISHVTGLLQQYDGLFREVADRAITLADDLLARSARQWETVQVQYHAERQRRLREDDPLKYLTTTLETCGLKYKIDFQCQPTVGGHVAMFAYDLPTRSSHRIEIREALQLNPQDTNWNAAFAAYFFDPRYLAVVGETREQCARQMGERLLALKKIEGFSAQGVLHHLVYQTTRDWFDIVSAHRLTDLPVALPAHLETERAWLAALEAKAQGAQP